MKSEYLVNFNIQADEALVKDFVIKQSNIVSLRRTWSIGCWPISFTLIGGDKDPRFKELLSELANQFIRKETDKGKYNQRYYYALEGEVKKRLHGSGWFFLGYEEEFFGFEDPEFYCNEAKVAYVIGHERYIFLFLDDTQKDFLTAGGIELESVNN